MTTSTMEIQRSSQRFKTQLDWLDSRHSFSFADHFDAGNTHHGLLLVNNDDVIKGGTGFSTHPHRDMEIITWVLDGEVYHKDSQGNAGVIHPGLAQRMSAGSGIWHSEMNPNSQKDVHLVQMWVLPDVARMDPSYQQLDISSQVKKGGLVPLASGRAEHAAIAIRQKDATLWVSRLKSGESVTLPSARFLHLYIAKGGGSLPGAEHLEGGDAVRLMESAPLPFSAGPQGAEVLIWEMNATFRY
jgi:quercetin 2,3-dioxygenase